MSTVTRSFNLDELHIDEVYEYYDHPCLFTAKTKSGQIFLVVFIDQTDSSNIWLYAPISSTILNSLKANEIDLKSAFSQTEDNFVYKVEIPSNNSNAKIEEVPCQDLTDDQLPIAGEFLDLVDHSSTVTTDETLPVQKIKSQEARELTRIMLSPRRGIHQENQLKPLSKPDIFDLLVEAFYNLMRLIKEPKVPKAFLGILMMLSVNSGPLSALTKLPEEPSQQDFVQHLKIAKSQFIEAEDNKNLDKFMEAISELQRLISEKANELETLPMEESEIENIARLESDIAELKAIEKRIEASREALSLLNPETQQEYLKALAQEAGDAALVAHPELKAPGGGADSIDNIQQFYFNIEGFLFLIYKCLIVCRPNLLDMALAEEESPLEPLPATAYVAAFKFIREQKISDAIPSEAAKELKAYFDYLIEKLVSTT